MEKMEKYDDMFTRLDIIPAFYGRTDGRTETVQQYRALHAMHADAQQKMSVNIKSWTTKSSSSLSASSSASSAAGVVAEAPAGLPFI